jgi:hypothetical protein
MVSDDKQANDIFIVFEDLRPVEVCGLEKLNEQLAAKSAPLLWQEMLWGKEHFEDFQVRARAGDQRGSAVVDARKWRNAALVAEMELDRRAAKRVEDLAKKTTWITVIVGATAAIIGAIVGAVLQANLGG